MRALEPHLERHLERRYPHWFRGRRARLTRPLLGAIGRWSRLPDLASFLAANGHLRGFDFLRAALAYLRADHRVAAADLAAIPALGRLLIVANHPSGALDALALLEAVGRVRRDVKIVANDLLGGIAPLAELMLPIRIMGGRPSPDSLRAIERALEAEQCVIVFPAGEVSRLGWRGVRDGPWRDGFARYARKTGAPVLPARVRARNSALFYGASALYKPASTALLAREMFARRGRPLRLYFGAPLRIDAQADLACAVREVRARVEALGRAGDADDAVAHAAGEQLGAAHAADASAAAPIVVAPIAAAPIAVAPIAVDAIAAEPIADPIGHDALIVGIAQTEAIGKTADGKDILLARLDADAPLLLEIGRLRELTFRAVGEGTGRARDVDDYDPHYRHILVWDGAAGKIAGAYRVARGARVLARHGLAGLYTASLFRYTERALPRLAQGMELGRSFVVPDYWGTRSLDYLWQGIGAYLRRYPDVRYLFGAVSISAALPLPAREQLVAYYQRYYGSGDPVAASLRPFRYFEAPPCFGEVDADTAFDVLKTNLAAHGATVPVLYKQYTELCEPGGARFLAFGVDPAFSDSIDGLIEIDLQRVSPKKRRRYLQPRDATA